MKKIITRSLIVFASLLFLTSIYILILPERSEQILQKKVADSSDAVYQKDELTRFNEINDKKISEELASIHQSELINFPLIEHAIKEFGTNSKEVRNTISLKEYQDSINLSKVTRIVNKYGWPGAERIGAQNNYTLFTTIQNADLETRHKFIPEMAKAVKQGSLSPQLYASFIDRNALTEKGFQIYGTQLTQDQKNKKIILAPICDEMKVNERRREIGLVPINLTTVPEGIVYLKSEG